MSSGRISRLVHDQGYGFILEDGRAEEIEFHWSAVATGSLEQLRVGQRLEFDKRPHQREGGRTRAVNIRLIKE
jgi:cold shock CspA family protein